MSVGGLWGLLGFVLGRVRGEGEQLSVSNRRPELVYILVTLIKFQEEKVREGSVCFSLCFEGLRSYPLSPIYSGMAASWRKNELEGSRSLYDGRKQKEWERDAGKYSKHGLIYVHLPVTFFLQVSPTSQSFQNLPQSAGTAKKNAYSTWRGHFAVKWKQELSHILDWQCVFVWRQLTSSFRAFSLGGFSIVLQV